MKAKATLNNLTSPLAVKAAIAECDRLSRTHFLKTYGFEPATTYVLRYNGQDYDSKAIAAVAFGLQHGTRALHSDECYGGKGSGHAGSVLSRLGFHVSGINTAKDWRIDEVEHVVNAYFRMMDRKSVKKPIDSALETKSLRGSNPQRSDRAIDLKLHNVSAALAKLGLPYLSEYPTEGAEHFQKLIQYVLEDRIGRNEIEPIVLPSDTEDKDKPLKIDWAERDAKNRELGEAGERYIFEQQKKRLAEEGRHDLSQKVRWLAQESDTYGYDIESYNGQGTKIQIEVKTTAHGKKTSFFVSANELKASKVHASTYEIHRVSNFFGKRDIEVRTGPIDQFCELTSSIYRAKIHS